MPKLGVFSGEEICRILETEGFLRVRQKGTELEFRASACPSEIRLLLLSSFSLLSGLSSLFCLRILSTNRKPTILR